ncbi:methyltransferase type 11 [Methanobacterium sp. MZ-A1]|uniref:class I SAM-dependent methyltransferase n=1 Tax=Methanobacterium sp. MZ-A1 TaxID=1911685 RepID=UPI000C2D5107|nr:class I SAM-dependent methyltransferase [Methanobacterium sp. MZ-A1]AUB58822.1 methyltransferase type 11 [Methanobacterium sp. MZ-A1]
MSNENQTIHEFDLNIIYDYFQNTERQGPGSPEITLKALSFIDGLTAESKIADIGCGTGGQTMVLAQNTASEIIGVDLFPEFIQQFNQNIQNQNLQERVKGVTGDMKDLPFKEGELDLIWSEGAIYNIGFERGLGEWRKFLKTGGYMAVTENTWFTQERPTEIEDFWQEAYPEIDTISGKVAQMEKAGYLPIATFVVPEACWIDYYEVQHPQMQESLLEKYKGNKSAEEFIAYQQYEAELYRKYKEYYGYVFYIGKRIR